LRIELDVAVEGFSVLVAAAAVAVGRLPGAVVDKADIKEAVTAATFAVQVAAAVAGIVDSFAAAAVVEILLDEKAMSGFPGRNIQNLFASVRAARRGRHRILVRYATKRVF
jgi:hypothetical protein